jgi:hypothetical protein
MLECSLDDLVLLPLPSTDDDGNPAGVRGDTVTWTTNPEHAGAFIRDEDPATGAKFKPSIVGIITIAVAAQRLDGKVLTASVELNVHGRQATKLNLSAKLAPKMTVVPTTEIDATVDTAQH